MAKSIQFQADAATRKRSRHVAAIEKTVFPGVPRISGMAQTNATNSGTNMTRKADAISS